MKGASVILRRLGNSRPSSFMAARSSLLSSSCNETLMLSAAAAASFSTLILSDEWRRPLFNSAAAPTVSAISQSILRFDHPRSLSTDASSGPSKIISIESEEQFNDSLRKAQDESLPTIFYFTAAWCGPCRLISPIIGQLSVKYPHVHTYKIDIDKEALAAALSKSNIQAVDLRGGILFPVQGMPSPLFAIEINPEKTKEDFCSAIQKDGGAGVKSFMDSMGLGMFSQQCMRGVALVPLGGAQSSLFPLEINSEKMKENFQSAIQRNYDSDVKDFMDGMGLGLLSQQLEELELGELLVTPPLGLDKATAISKACYTTPRSSIDAVYQPIKIQRSSSKIIQCGPKKIKFAKQRRGRMKGIAHRGNHICFGRYALQALEPGWITSKQLESGRRALARNLGRGVKIWVRVFPDKPVTARPAETRMGRGKGNVQFWVAVVQPGRILYEMGGTSESIARQAISVAASKLPIRTRFISLE